MHELLDKLTGGDRRSIGQSNEVAAAVLRDPSLFSVVFSGLWSTDALVRMRAADALEKITAKHPEWLQPYKEQIRTGSKAVQSRGRKLLRKLTATSSSQESRRMSLKIERT